MNKYAIHINSGGATFVKEYDYFVSQGGLTEKWGKAWKIIEAEDMDQARVIANQETGAFAGLYCWRCGKDSVKCKGHKEFNNLIYTKKDEDAASKVIEWLKTATPKEIMDLSVKAGIYNEDGTLTENYKDE